MPREENAASGGISPVRDSGTSLAYQSKSNSERNRSHNERDKEEPAPSEEQQTPLNTQKIAISSEDAGPVVECQSPPRLHAGSAGGMKAGTAPHRAKEGLASDSSAPSVDSLARFSRFLSLLVVSALEEQTPSTTERERMALAELVRARRVGPEKTIRTILLRVYGGGLRRLCACYHVCMMYHISYVLRLPSLRSKARSRDGPVSPSLPRPPPRPPPHHHAPSPPPSHHNTRSTCLLQTAAMTGLIARSSASLGPEMKTVAAGGRMATEKPPKAPNKHRPRHHPHVSKGWKLRRWDLRVRPGLSGTGPGESTSSC